MVLIFKYSVLTEQREQKIQFHKSKRGDFLLDNDTLEHYCKEYYDDVFRFCLSKLHNREDAYDATQETFLFFKMRSFDLVEINIKSWLLWVAHYRIQNIYAKRNKDKALFDAYSEEEYLMDKNIENIEMQIVDNNIGKYANEIYSALSDKEKALFKMLYVDDMSEKHIAQKLNLEPHAVYMRVSRMKKKISQFVLDELMY